MSYEVVARPLRVAVLTVSDTRTLETDKGGNKVQEFLEAANHIVADRKIVIDDCEAIINIAMRDVTIEAVNSLYEKHIPGFGEIFRYLSYTEDIGTKAMASRAEAGVKNNTLMFSIPGSVGAVTLAMSKLIIPEMGHLVREITK